MRYQPSTARSVVGTTKPACDGGTETVAEALRGRALRPARSVRGGARNPLAVGTVSESRRAQEGMHY